LRLHMTTGRFESPHGGARLRVESRAAASARKRHRHLTRSEKESPRDGNPEGRNFDENVWAYRAPRSAVLQMYLEASCHVKRGRMRAPATQEPP
jgi:hypothetical protein